MVHKGILGRVSGKKEGQKTLGDRKEWREKGAPEEHIFLCTDLQTPERGKPCMMHPKDCCSSNCKEICYAPKRI